MTVKTVADRTNQLKIQNGRLRVAIHFPAPLYLFKIRGIEMKPSVISVVAMSGHTAPALEETKKTTIMAPPAIQIVMT